LSLAQARSDKEAANEKSFGHGDSARHLCGVFHPACGDRTSSDRDRVQAGRQRPREPHGFYCAAPVHAVTLVARGSDGDVVIKQAAAQPAVEASKLQLDIALKSMMAVAQQAKSAENRLARIQSSLGILAPFVRVLRIQREDP
jgi:hypothetical protein